MSLDSLTPDETSKIKTTIASGEQVLQEIDDLKESMAEYVKGLSEELDIKPKVINKAIKLAHKQKKENAIEAAQTEMSEVEILLHAAGKI